MTTSEVVMWETNTFKNTDRRVGDEEKGRHDRSVDASHVKGIRTYSASFAFFWKRILSILCH